MRGCCRHTYGVRRIAAADRLFTYEMPQSLARPDYRTLYSFGKRFSGGREPKAALIEVNGTLYGTTFAGGSTKCIGGCGIVFMITPSGKETVVYRFRGGDDGANPSASLLAVKGILYGTTEYGGGEVNGGTVFEISATRRRKGAASLRIRW